MMSKGRTVLAPVKRPQQMPAVRDTRRDLSQFGRATSTGGGDILFHCEALSFDVFARVTGASVFNYCIE